MAEPRAQPEKAGAVETQAYEQHDYEAARRVLDQFSWGSNVFRGGRLVGQQYVVAEAVAELLATERAAGADEIERLRAENEELRTALTVAREAIIRADAALSR